MTEPLNADEEASIRNGLAARQALAAPNLGDRLALRFLATLDFERAARAEPTRWHGNLVCPGAEVCTEQDEDGAHAYADPHSPDWYDGYAEGQHDAARASRPEPGDKQPHDRLAEAEAAMFSRLADAASRPEPQDAPLQPGWSEFGGGYSETHIDLTDIPRPEPGADPELPDASKASR